MLGAQKILRICCTSTASVVSPCSETITRYYIFFSVGTPGIHACPVIFARFGAGIVCERVG